MAPSGVGRSGRALKRDKGKEPVRDDDSHAGVDIQVSAVDAGSSAAGPKPTVAASYLSLTAEISAAIMSGSYDYATRGGLYPVCVCLDFVCVLC